MSATRGQSPRMSKKSKRRHCPALGKEITSQECGADRISRIACTADCPFNTFAVENYGEYSETEERVLDKIRQRLLKWLTPERASALVSRIEAAGNDAARSQYHYMQELFHTKNREGQNFWQAWEAAGWQGLNNDERIITEAHAKTRTVLLEMRQVLTPDTFEAVDLLRPQDPPLVIADHSCTSRLRRFQVVITWLYPLPHYWRLSGAANMVEEAAGLSPLAVCHEIARHLGGPAELPALSEWLWQHFTRWNEAHVATLKARWAAMVKEIDAKSVTIEYAVQGFAALCEALDEHPQFSESGISPEEAAKGCERRYDVLTAPEVEGATQAVTGSLFVTKKKLRAEASTGASAAQLKALLESAAGNSLRFVSEKTEDLAARMLEKRGDHWDPSLVPPRLLEQPRRIEMQTQRSHMETGTGSADLERAFLQANIDNLRTLPIPALNGLTPAEAAQDPAMRPALIELMKTHVRNTDDIRQRRGLDVDMNPLLESLGLHEIILPAPPLPEVPEEKMADESEYADEDERGEGYDLSPPIPLEAAAWSAPVRVKKVLTPKMMESAIEGMRRDWPTPEDMLDWLDAKGAVALDILESPVLSRLEEREFTILEMMVARAAYALRPGGWDPDLSINDRRFAFYANGQMSQLMSVVESKSPAALEKFAANSPQPDMSTLLCEQLLEICEHKTARVKMEKALMLMALLKGAIHEFCAVLAE